MEIQEIKIEVYDKREKITVTMYVEQLAGNTFRMTENDIFNCRLTKGVEFETRINKEGKHEVVRIVKESEFITRRFLLSSEYNESVYRMLGDELVKYGGFWQTDFGGIATINIPKDLTAEVNKLMKDLNINLSEIVDEE